MRHDGATTYHTFQEILSQPQAWRGALDEIQAQADAIRDLWQSSTRQEVILTGCGSPYYAARTAALLLQQVGGVPASAHPASELVLFPDMTIGTDHASLLVALSRSGETTETLEAIETFRARTDNPVIGITCYPDSRLARSASHTVLVRDSQEQSLAQTRSLTSMLIAAQGMIFSMAGQPLSDAFLQLPEHCSELLEHHQELGQQLGVDARFERFFFLGSGPFYGLACEAMLKMKEMSLSYSEAFHFLEFRHGPMSMVNERTLIVGLLSETALPHELAVLADMRAMGAHVLAITPVALPARQVDFQVVLSAGLSDVERGALYLPVLQLLAFHRAVRNGLDPDQPTNLTAVVNLDFAAIAKQPIGSMSNGPGQR